MAGLLHPDHIFMKVKNTIILFIVTIISLAALAANFPLENVVPGLKGVGKTVFSGTKVEDFPVEVLGVLPGSGVVGDLILIKVGGKALELGGIAEGMSGSPVYIDGQLLGAISYGFNDYDHALGLVTPIGEMEKLLALQTKKDELIIEDERLRSLATPIYVTGLGERSRTYLEKQLGYSLAQNNLGQVKAEEIKLEPGSALTAALVTGDITVGSFGTLTTIYEDGKFLAFGHPLFNRGKTTYLAGSSIIHTIIKGQPNTYKLASYSSKVGLISEDRGAGVLGTTKETPVMIPVEITINEKDLDRAIITKAEIIPDNMLFAKLATSAVLEGFDRGLDRLGAGTAKVKFSIKGKGLPYTLERSNFFYSYVDISALSVSELAEALDLLLYNDYYDVELSEVSVHADITENRKTAVITNATATSTIAKPGDDIFILIQIRPFRGEQETISVNLPIPKDVTPGKVKVTIRPGTSISSIDESSVNVSDKLELQTDERKGTPLSQEAKDWEKLLKDFVSREKNNEIVIEFYPPVDEESYLESDVELPPPVQVKVDTEYVMEGEANVDLEIML